jgi:hypothetical protein
MIVLDSDRSSADSRAATTAGEFCSPHGVRTPQLVRLAEVVARPQLLEIVEPVRRWFVVLGDAKLRTGSSRGR